MNESNSKRCSLIADTDGWRATLVVVNADLIAEKRHLYGTGAGSPHVSGTGKSPEAALTNAFAELGRAYFALEQSK